MITVLWDVTPCSLVDFYQTTDLVSQMMLGLCIKSLVAWSILTRVTSDPFGNRMFSVVYKSGQISSARVSGGHVCKKGYLSD
jgi:hypothetical protein